MAQRKKRTIAQAELECREAWKAQPKAKHGWCIHHLIEFEKLSEPIENRIDYILSDKKKSEQVTRLDNMRPVTPKSLRKVQKARRECSAACELAWETYGKVRASMRQRDEENRKAASVVRGQAIASASKAYDEAKAAAHLADVPNHTWDGRSIFPVKVRTCLL